MASTYSPSLKLELMGNGDQAGTWGTTTNNNLGTLLEQAITGVQTITLLDADHTLTNINGASDEARNAVLVVNGTTSAIRNIIAPTSQQKTYIVTNSTVGGFGITVKTASGAGVTIPYGATQIVYTDGTNFYLAASQTVVAAGTGINVSTVGTTATVSNTGVVTVTPSTGISASTTGTNVTIANTGVTSITGTANQVTASASTGGVTLSLPSTINVNISGNAATATNANYATNAGNANYANSAGSANNGLVADSLGGSGYAQVGGLIIQWLTVTVGTTGGNGMQGPYGFNWPRGFPNTCLFASCSTLLGGSLNSSGTGHMDMYSYNGSNFEVFYNATNNGNGGTGQNLQATVFAVGY